MDNEESLLAELNGMFSNRTECHPKLLIDVTEENCNAFRLWLEKEWAELPDALPTKTAASLIGCQPQRIYELIKENVLHGIKIGAVQYIPKWHGPKNWLSHAQRNIKSLLGILKKVSAGRGRMKIEKQTKRFNLACLMHQFQSLQHC